MSLVTAWFTNQVIPGSKNMDVYGVQESYWDSQDFGHPLLLYLEMLILEMLVELLILEMLVVCPDLFLWLSGIAYLCLGSLLSWRELCLSFPSPETALVVSEFLLTVTKAAPLIPSLLSCPTGVIPTLTLSPQVDFSLLLPTYTLFYSEFEWSISSPWSRERIVLWPLV